ncbi:MAG TPA: hypothetical protein VN786_07555 [Acidimicrobiales bacterium]|nr:hypothetical protein [Acidimicrobiales bacterium]
MPAGVIDCEIEPGARTVRWYPGGGPARPRGARLRGSAHGEDGLVNSLTRKPVRVSSISSGIDPRREATTIDHQREARSDQDQVAREASEQLSGIRFAAHPHFYPTVQLWPLGDEHMANNDQEILRMATTR